MSLTIEDNRTFFSDPINPIYACVNIMYIIHSFEMVNYFTYEKNMFSQNNWHLRNIFHVV